MPMFEGRCASEVLQSVPRCAEYTGAHLKCLYTNACSMRNKQEELEALAQSQSYDIIGISETWWDESCDWGAMMDGYRLFRRDRQGRRGGGVALYIREGLDCMALTVGNNTVESLWVLMSLHEMFPAVHASEIAVQRNPCSWDVCSLGRAQLGLGEIALAIQSFQASLHIFPMNPEVWKEDLSWARKLHEEQKATKTEAVQALAKEKAAQESVPDYDFESDEIVAVCAAIAEKEKALSAAKMVVIVSASGTVDTVTEKENCPTTPDKTLFIRA
ncbi:LOW QUALITY PROTEIN: tetratricopeptide repeat protein 33-like [Ciconia maguari]